MTVKLPDGSELELPDGATGADAAAAIGPGLAKAALALRVDGELRDLAGPLAGGESIEIVTDRDPDALQLIRHDAAHVMAEAVVELWPGTKVTIGPPIEDGFYYDFEFPDGVNPSDGDLEGIEAAMAAHIKADEPFERRDVPTADAIEKFGAEGQDYKVELIEDLVRDEGVETVSLYRNGPFEDLCRGPHGPSTGRVAAFKLNSLAGAYWRGDEARQMLTRIYGTAFFSKKDLDQHLERVEEARARDHRRVGPQLGLFMLRGEAPGMPFWLPNGTLLLRAIEAEVQEQLRKRGYVEIKTPRVLDEELWHRSGHWDNYRENMFFVQPSEREGDERRFALKPMNCPGACLVFGSERHSYRELPLRLAEFGDVSRYEREGVLHGLLRVRAFTQDDAHVYCTLDQVTDEVDSICEAIDELYARFGFDQVRVELSTRPDKSIGTDEQWERAEASLREALERQGREYDVAPGEGTFYGPKIDFHITDALGRSWQCGTCQLDFFMPERFGLTYTGADNAEHTPVMIHRALL
ncbi:MAG: threonine--tRNA ligase, partial [Actinomycetota bacterium]